MKTLACLKCSFWDNPGNIVGNCQCPSSKVHLCYYAEKMSDSTWISYHASVQSGSTQMELFPETCEAEN